MKKLGKYLLIVAIAFIVVYYIGSFYSTSFNIREWKEGTRAVGTYMLILTSVLGLIPSFGD